MKIKRFTANDMREAIRLVREEQGPDAVILSNKRVNGQVEVVAATDYDEALVRQAVRAAPRQPGDKSEAADAAPAPTRPLALPADPELGAMRRELGALRILVQKQTAAFALSQLRQQPGRAEALDDLDRIGVEQSLAQELVTRVPAGADASSARRMPIGMLAKEIPLTEEDPVDRGGTIALVGPTGAGKTTTIAKLAARYGAKHGLRSVALVTTDHYRIGAREQLYTYGRLLGVPVHEAHDAGGIAQLLERLREYKLVLVDTAGLSPGDRQLPAQLEMLRNMRHYVVLAANCQTADLHDVVARYAPLKPEACVITKLDETTRLGGALSVAIARKLPLAYVSDGQRVPEDLHLARSHRLVVRAMQAPRTPPSNPEDVHAAA